MIVLIPKRLDLLYSFINAGFFSGTPSNVERSLTLWDQLFPSMGILLDYHVPTIDYPPKIDMTTGNHHFQQEIYTSLNGLSSSVMLVFRGVDLQSHSCLTWDFERLSP